MEFIVANLLNTTTQLTVNSNTGTAQNLYNRDPLYQYYSDQLANDNTTSSITVTFDVTTPVSRIALLDTNFKSFNIFYNGVTANIFSLTDADTASSSYTSNLDTNKFFRFPTTMCSSITIQAKATMITNQEKLLGLLVLSDNTITLNKIPNAQAYRPRIVPKQVVHRLSDGGSRINTIRRKHEAALNLDYVDEDQRDQLLELYSNNNEFNFVPFGTATGWDGFMFEAVWEGTFDFYEFSDNAARAGFSGSIKLKETPV